MNIMMRRRMRGRLGGKGRKGRIMGLSLLICRKIILMGRNYY